MDCREAKDLFVAHILGDLDAGSRQSRGLEAHLESCRTCSEEYESCKHAVGFLEAHKAEFAAALESVENKTNQQEELERSWRSIKTKLDRLEAQEKREKRGNMRRILVKVSAAAACLAIGAFAWLMLPDSTPTQKPVPQGGASAPAPLIRIALLSETGRVAIASGQTVSTSAGEMKTLVINDRHRLAMNTDCTVSIEPLRDNERLGCRVNLDSGQIYANVEHDGNPFVVATAHGRAVITGTIFDVRATEASTTLVVADGRVRFESEQGVAEVAAGQVSEIIANSVPTKPRSCDAAKLTAWATGLEFRAILAKIAPYSDDYDLTDLWLSANSGPIDLESVNYRKWTEAKRAWFEREFPWAFELQVALAAEGIKADYPQLLLSSGDIWQSAYPETSPQQIPIPYLDPMLNAASRYGFDKQWLTENVPASKSAITSSSAPEGRLTGLNALGEWMACVDQMRRSSEPPDAATLLYSLHAGVYLANTRSLVWLGISTGEMDVSATERADILASLQAEVDTASQLCGHVVRLLTGSEDEPCDECQMLLRAIVENIATITAIERGRLDDEGREQE